MNIYKQKQRWKLILFMAAVAIGVASLTYTNILVGRLASEERKKVELLAEAFTRIVSADINDPNLGFYSQIILENENVPVILVDSLNDILSSQNLDSVKMGNEKYVRRKLEQMQDNSDPIVIELSDTENQYLFYGKSTLLIKLTYYPYIQLIIILLFISVAYFAFSNSRKAEQNQVWVGLSKETAHQLGTPISSLMAWFEVLKSRGSNEELLIELEKDVKRLEIITERFSKIGSNPLMIHENVGDVILSAVHYLETRLSDKITFHLDLPHEAIQVPLNKSLFEWVVENLCKNAVDALNGIGQINISLKDYTQIVYIDIADTGKGMQKSMFRTIFKPGFTTKKTGWGLGLSLAKRIIEEYHDGRIFVHQSEINKGTVFRIVLNKRARKSEKENN